MKQRIALLGSTGSIGIQTLDIVRENPGLFEITTLTAHRNWERLARQAVEFDADSVVIADERRYDALRQALDGTSIKVYAGEEALRQVVQSGQVDVVVNALVGYAGLMPTIAAVEAGKKVALANKETLVAGGCYVMPLAARHKAPIVPIDSEHSAIFQCLTGEKSPVRRLIVTCSGGAFRDRSREELAHVTVEQALKHPQWRMGDKITIDSATLVNKGFEVIEAHWLFGVPAERISVLIHPQSIVHSMVEFGDGAIKAQLGSPDMRTPIAYALSFPQRLDRPVAPFSFAEHPTLTFAEVDRIKYPALDLAYDCLRRGGTAGCTMNGANEVAVAAFLARRCGYLEIVRSIEYALGKSSFAAVPSLGDLGEANAEARCLAAEYLRLPFIVDSVSYTSAVEAGLESGDEVVAIDDLRDADYPRYRDYLQKHKNDKVLLTVRRDGALIDSLALPVDAEGRIGVTVTNPYSLRTQYYTFWESIPAGIHKAGKTISSYWDQLKLIVQPKTKMYEELGGFVAIGSIFPSSWDWHDFWLKTAFLSIILAVMNLLPIPGLDGGHALFTLWEIITRRKPSEKFLEVAQYVGLMIILALLVYANGNDIYRFFIK